MTRQPTDPSKPKRRRKTAQRWHLVTNHQNMLYLLAAGMAMGPAGFRGKHYTDPSSVWPGQIPLFRDGKIPASALRQATSEQQHLLPCIASFDLGEVSGAVSMLSTRGRTRSIDLPVSRRNPSDLALLVPAPVPLTLLSGISFRSPEDQQAFESAANDVSNVDLSFCQIKVEESLFSGVLDLPWTTEPPQAGLLEEERDHFPAFGQALGGALAMLYHLANRSDPGLAVWRSITASTGDQGHGLVPNDPVLAELPHWIREGEVSARANIHARLFWGVVNSLVSGQTRECPPPPVDIAVGYLEDQLGSLTKREFRPVLERLISDMRDSTGLGGGTITELLERNPDPVARGLLLFCLRSHCTELLEFSHDLLHEVDCLLAGILFGVRDGWLQLPREMRTPALSSYVICRMADAEHRQQNHKLTLVASPHPIPLREFFTLPFAQWNKARKRMALDLARQCQWHDCLQTRITLPEGDFPASFERQGRQLVVPGELKVTDPEVNRPALLHRLGQWPPIAHAMEASLHERHAAIQQSARQTDENGTSCG